MNRVEVGVSHRQDERSGSTRANRNQHRKQQQFRITLDQEGSRIWEDISCYRDKQRSRLISKIKIKIVGFFLNFNIKIDRYM